MTAIYRRINFKPNSDEPAEGDHSLDGAPPFECQFCHSTDPDVCERMSYDSQDVYMSCASCNTPPDSWYEDGTDFDDDVAAGPDRSAESWFDYQFGVVFERLIGCSQYRSVGYGNRSMRANFDAVRMEALGRVLANALLGQEVL
jgi:hypothetical protein